jgi:hypothetical protein
MKGAPSFRVAAPRWTLLLTPDTIARFVIAAEIDTKPVRVLSETTPYWCINAVYGNVSAFCYQGLIANRLRFYRAMWCSMELDEKDEGKSPNLVTTLASIAIDAAKLVTGVPLDYPDPLLTPLATVPQPAKEDPIMDDEKDKPLVDQMTDVVADAAGELAKTAVKAVAKRAKKAVISHTPKPVKKAAKAVAKAAKTPKKTAKKAMKRTAKNGKKTAKKSPAKKTAKKKSKKSKKSKR